MFHKLRASASAWVPFSRALMGLLKSLFSVVQALSSGSAWEGLQYIFSASSVGWLRLFTVCLKRYLKGRYIPSKRCVLLVFYTPVSWRLWCFPSRKQSPGGGNPRWSINLPAR
jgi:hypothetical protein